MTDRHPVWQLLDQLQMDARAMNAKLDTLRREMTAFDVAPTTGPAHRCDCGWTGSSLVKFQEHQYRSHDGAVPEHYLAAERAAGYEVAAGLTRPLDAVLAEIDRDEAEAARLTGSTGERATTNESDVSGRVS